ncbi:MAG: bifunctional lysylphosphatidylglycerol flippase/synthetase MprF [Candidatus Eisenbacteria bacterium]
MMSRLARLLRRIGPFAVLGAFLVALGALHGALGQFHYHEIREELARLPAWRIWAALALTLASHLLLPGYDHLSLQQLKISLAPRRVAFASLVASAISSGLGFPLLTGEALRYRLYAGWGLSALQIGALIVLNGAAYALGGLVLAGGLALRDPLPTNSMGSIWPLLGALALLLPIAYLALAGWRRRPLRVLGASLELPTLPIALGQLGVSLLSWVVAAAVAFVLLPSHPALPFDRFLQIFILAQAVGLLSHVPQGLVVFETMVLTLIDAQVPVPAVLAGLLVYRAIFYLLPLVVSLVAVSVSELRRRGFGDRAGEVWQRFAPALLPQLLAGMTFLGGLLLLASGATPAIASRLHWLEKLLPLGLIETSHFLGSIVGLLLIFLARGLARRIDSAHAITLGLLAVGAVASLGKGGDFEEAIVLAGMLALLLPCRYLFTRKGSLLHEPFTARWFLGLGLAIAGTTWLGLFAYKHVTYSDELFWQFSLHGDAPRFLRASVGVAVLALLLSLVSLLSPRPEPFHVASEEELERARGIARGAPESFAQLVLTGDKALLFSESGRSFLMYGIAGRTWVAFRDPIGEASERAELAWRFRELADRAGGWTVFQEVAAANLPLYLDLGLALLKAGEEARVPLRDFGLDGGARASLRHSHHRAVRDGLSFRVVPREEVPTLLPTLRRISDLWLEQKDTREKRFSLGFFEPRYLADCPIALVESGGEAVGFANLWLSGQGEELSIDLMRFVPEAGRGVMDFLFVELMLWGRAQGFAWFNLGLAPLSGLEPHAYAPAWNRVGALVFRHGEHFYNFEGLRNYKAKFDPRWEPRYFALPGGLRLPQVLGDVATLTAGGWRGLIGK